MPDRSRHVLPRARIVGVTVLSLFSVCELPAAQPRLDVFTHEIMRVRETWRVLDRMADLVWPGWTGYDSVPFQFDFPDGTRLLVGHPAPPDGFVLYDTTSLPGKRIYIDRRGVLPLNMDPPLFGGGGIIPIGMLDGKPVPTVCIRLSASRSDGRQVDVSRTPGETAELPPGLRHQLASERQILIYVHELFHCFQEITYRWRYGNLQYNPDENYATFAEIEGLALEQAFFASDSIQRIEFLQDFLLAREMKRRSMDSIQQRQESEQELMEGGATYAEMKTLELLAESHARGGMRNDDPYFFAFADRDSFSQGKVEMLRSARVSTLNATGKTYAVGAFQALLLSRLFPGWQQDVYRSDKTFDRIIAEQLRLSEADRAAARMRIETRYPLASIRERHSEVVRERNALFTMIRSRKGTTYIVNFKPTHEHIASQPRTKNSSLGLMYMYPEGIDSVRIEQVRFTGNRTPMVLDQLYYIKWIDTEPDPGTPGYALTYARKEREDVYCDAVFSTEGFTLRAPKIEVTQRPDWVKVTILTKVKE